MNAWKKEKSAVMKMKDTAHGIHLDVTQLKATAAQILLNIVESNITYSMKTFHSNSYKEPSTSTKEDAENTVVMNKLVKDGAQMIQKPQRMKVTALSAVKVLTAQLQTDAKQSHAVKLVLIHANGGRLKPTSQVTTDVQNTVATQSILGAQEKMPVSSQKTAAQKVLTSVLMVHAKLTAVKTHTAHGPQILALMETDVAQPELMMMKPTSPLSLITKETSTAAHKLLT